MTLIKQIEDNLYCLRELTAKKIAKMNTYNYRGFVGHVTKKGDLYIVDEITGATQITGNGLTLEDALKSFETAVVRNLNETSKDSQKKMLVRRFAKMERIHSRINSINQAELKRKVDDGQKTTG